MTTMRAVLVALLLGVSACSQPAPTAPPAPAAEGQNAAQPALNVLTPLISAEIGKPIVLQASTSNVSGEWAYIVATPTNADGSPIDWRTTNLASRYENGAMDENGSVHALLQQQNGVWVVVEHVIAPTDVAWLDWPARHSVPAGVIDAPAAP